jgi:hypothetical protein
MLTEILQVIKYKSENKLSYLNHTLPKYDTGGSGDLKRAVAISSADFKYSLIAYKKKKKIYIKDKMILSFNYK